MMIVGYRRPTETGWGAAEDLRGGIAGTSRTKLQGRIGRSTKVTNVQ